MANSLNINTNNPVAGLGDFAYTTTQDGYVTVQVKSTIPCDPGSQLDSSKVSPQASALQIVIKQNSTAKVTVGGSSTNPTPNQPSMGASAQIQCVAGDVIHVVLSSANAIDNQPNTVKSDINLFLGE